MTADRKLTESLACLIKAAQDISFSSDLVRLKYELKEVQRSLLIAYTLVDTAIDNSRHIRKQDVA